jgi:hypothetical protein
MNHNTANNAHHYDRHICEEANGDPQKSSNKNSSVIGTLEIYDDNQHDAFDRQNGANKKTY